MVKRKMTHLSLITIILEMFFYAKASLLNSQPQFTVKAVANKEFDKSCLIGTFNTGDMANCLEHCLKDCRWQSFQICPNTKCQLCSSHKEENSSLLQENGSCIYAVYEMQQMTKTLQLNGQCSVMNCPIKFNCCQQSGICPKNKICVPLNFPEQPWKRFACKCPDGYHGDSCAQPIRSCESYANGSRISGMYNVTAYNGTVYEVYCHFDSDASWTLVQSYSFANASSYESKFRKPLYESHPVSKNSLTWSGYRLSKPRMKSIQHNSAFLQFTCEYEKTRDVTKSDYVQIPFEDIKEHSTVVDILEYNVTTGYLTVREGRGQIGNNDVSHCKIWLHQSSLYSLGIGFTRNYQTTSCKTSDLSQLSCPSTSTYYLFRSNSRPCIREVHRCLQHRNSTTQLWFGSPTFTAM